MLKSKKIGSILLSSWIFDAIIISFFVLITRGISTHKNVFVFISIDNNVSDEKLKRKQGPRNLREVWKHQYWNIRPFESQVRNLFAVSKTSISSS